MTRPARSLSTLRDLGHRQARAARKKQHQIQIKEVKMRPGIEPHDFEFKILETDHFDWYFYPEEAEAEEASGRTDRSTPSTPPAIPAR